MSKNPISIDRIKDVAEELVVNALKDYREVVLFDMVSLRRERMESEQQRQEQATTTIQTPINILNQQPQVPQSQVQVMSSSGWLVEGADRNQAERLLGGRTDGTFLVRKSSNYSQSGSMALSIIYHQIVMHCLIYRFSDGSFGMVSWRRFPTLDELVRHYSVEGLGEQFRRLQNARLVHPIFGSGLQ